MAKRNSVMDIIFPYKRLNIFVFSILIIGIISGSIFLVLMGNNDKVNVTNKIVNFFLDVSKNNLDNGLALRNSLIVNYLFILLIWFLGISVIGSIINIFLVYLKGFLVGFSISSIFLSYKLKGIIAALIYVFPFQIINIILIIIIAIYSISFSIDLFKIIISKKNINKKLNFKKYIVILMFSIIVSFLSSLYEVYLFPKILKLVISFYV